MAGPLRALTRALWPLEKIHFKCFVQNTDFLLKRGFGRHLVPFTEIIVFTNLFFLPNRSCLPQASLVLKP